MSKYRGSADSHPFGVKRLKNGYERKGEGTSASVRTTPKIERNKSCPCGSGKKYKQCHLNR